MAPERLKRNLPYLHVLSTAKKSQRNALINSANKDQLLCLCDCCSNFLKENIPFKESDSRKLLKYQDIVRYLAHKRKDSLKNKKAFIEQQGGFIPLLLTPILALAGSLLAEAIATK